MVAELFCTVSMLISGSESTSSSEPETFTSVSCGMPIICLKVAMSLSSVVFAFSSES